MKPQNLALEAAEMLVAAYRNGQRAGGHVDWEDVDQAWQVARAAVAEDRRERRTARARAAGCRHRRD